MVINIIVISNTKPKAIIVIFVALTVNFDGGKRGNKYTALTLTEFQQNSEQSTVYNFRCVFNNKKKTVDIK